MKAATATKTSTPFLLSPQVRNARGQVRRAGFELEYSGISLNLSATLVRTVFGGEHVAKTTFVHRVRGTRVGDFQVEIDTRVLKDKTYEQPLRAIGLDPENQGVYYAFTCEPCRTTATTYQQT